jgi:hypothetical protein
MTFFRAFPHGEGLFFSAEEKEEEKEDSHDHARDRGGQGIIKGTAPIVVADGRGVAVFVCVCRGVLLFM